MLFIQRPLVSYGSRKREFVCVCVCIIYKNRPTHTPPLLFSGEKGGLQVVPHYNSLHRRINVLSQVHLQKQDEELFFYRNLPNPRLVEFQVSGS